VFVGVLSQSGLPLRGITTVRTRGRAGQVLLDDGSAVAAVSGDGARRRPVLRMTRLSAGASCGASAGFPRSPKPRRTSIYPVSVPPSNVASPS